MAAALVVPGCATGGRTGTGDVQAPDRPAALAVRLVSAGPADGFRQLTCDHGVTTYVAEEAILSGHDFASAQAVQGGEGWAVDCTLTDEAAARFERFTGEHSGRRIAIVDGGELLSTVTIRGTVGKRIRITGRFSRDRAQELARMIRGH
ncbi:MAG: hypothetical protein GY778_23065 [bacterium]|nr:hypothetical protein [bacterium]